MEEPEDLPSEDHGTINQKVSAELSELLELQNWLPRRDIQIATISAAAIDLYIRSKRSDVFVTSLHCIDKAISRKKERLLELLEVKQKLP